MDLFGSGKLIILNDADFLTGSSTLEDEALNEYIKNPNEKTILIFKVIAEKLDERKKLVKLLKENSKVIEFKLLNEKNIDNYIINYFKNYNKEIDFEAVQEIKRRLIANPKVIDKELEKLLLYKINSNVIKIADVKNIIIKYEENNIFNLIDAVIKKDKNKIFNLYKKLKQEKEEPVVIISLIESQFRLILNTNILYKSGMDKNKIASYLKEHPYRVELALKNSMNISNKEIIKILRKLFEIDYNSKTGIQDRYSALEEFFIQL